MAASRFVEVSYISNKEVSEIKLNSDPKNTKKNLCKNTKTIIRLRLGDYWGIFTSTSSRQIFNNYSPKAKWLPVNIHRDEVEVNIHRNHWAWGEQLF
jgi:hypothetical protein